MKIIIDRGHTVNGLYYVAYGPTEDVAITCFECAFFDRWRIEVENKLTNVAEYDRLITMKLPNLKDTLLTIKHPLICENTNLRRLWMVRAKYNRESVDVIEFGKRIFDDGGIEHHVKRFFGK